MKARALTAAWFTTLLWSGSYIVNKVAFAQGIGPLTLSGVRYTLAGILLCAVLKKDESALANGTAQTLPMRWAVLQGLICYVLGQGCQYIGQSLLSPTVASLLLNSGMVVFIVAADRLRLREAPGMSLYGKIALMLAGMVMYYTPWSTPLTLPAAGLAAILAAAFGSAMNVTLNRYMLSQKGIERRSLTIRPMLFGGLMMLLVGALTEAPPKPSWKLALCVLYLAAASGALGFSLWVWSQQHISAVQSGCINNVMIIEIAVLDVLFFGRQLSIVQAVGILLTFAAILMVQYNKQRA